MSAPTVSVVMPAYNHEKFVGQAVRSVLSQSFADLELVIVDDGSSDNTADVIKSFNDARIKYHYQHNQDAFNAINNGMALATGQFVCIINSDDLYTPTRLERMLQTHESTGAHVVFSDIVLIDDAGEDIGAPDMWWMQWHENNRKYFYEYKDLYATFLHANVMVTTSNLFMTREAMQTVGNFEPLRYLHDYDYIFRLLNAFPDAVEYLHDEKLVHYRLHGSNTISDAAVVGREQDLMIIRTNLLKKFPENTHNYLNIGIDRLIELEHELVQAKADVVAARTQSSQPQPEPQPAPLIKPGLARRVVNRLLR